MPRAIDVDVVVVGAGVAGLAAARAIRSAGRSVAVVEARDRIGGRIHTLHRAGWSYPIELGAEFVHGAAPEIARIVYAAGLTAVDIVERHQRASESGPTRDDRFFPALESFLEHARRRARAGDVTVAEALASWSRSGRFRAELPMVRGYIEGFHAADPSRFGVRAFVEAESGDDDEALGRIVSGYDGVVQWLAAGLDPERDVLLLRSVVREIVWQRGSVTVRARTPDGTPHTPLRARAAIITLPLPLLAALPGPDGPVRFDPPVPSIQRAASRLAMGNAMRIVLGFRTAFWTDVKGRSQRMRFVQSPGATFPTWWTPDPVRAPMLTGWVGGPRAERLSGTRHDALVELALESAAQAFGVPRRIVATEMEHAHVHDWLADPFSRGAYAYVPAGAHNALLQLARPIDDTLFFAGEATHPHENGTVHGAIETGHRAATQLLHPSPI
jgi:monoamine oxidase